MKKENSYSPFNINLCGEWSFAWSEELHENVASAELAVQSGLEFFACTVPGNFELDLFQLGKVSDPFFGMNPLDVSKATEKCHVYYTCSFEAKDVTGATPYLIFEGLDCFADVYINGILAASLDNMLIEHTVNVKDLLNFGENELFIHIRPALLEAMKYEYPQLMSSHVMGSL